MALILILGVIAGVIAGAFLSSVLHDNKDEDLARTYILLGALFNWLSVAITILIIIFIVIAALIESIGE